MGVIKSSVTDINGKTTKTEVRTNSFEDFSIQVASRFGRGLEWRIVHRIEKRKLRKAVKEPGI